MPYSPPEIKANMTDLEKLSAVRLAVDDALQDYAENNEAPHFYPKEHKENTFLIRLPDGTEVEVSFKIHKN